MKKTFAFLALMVITGKAHAALGLNITNNNSNCKGVVTVYGMAPMELAYACDIISEGFTISQNGVPGSSLSFTDACNFESWYESTYSSFAWGTITPIDSLCPISSYTDFVWTDAIITLYFSGPSCGCSGSGCNLTVQLSVGGSSCLGASSTASGTIGSCSYNITAGYSGGAFNITIS